MMKRLFIALCLCLCLLPAFVSAVNLTPTNATWYAGSSYEGHIANYSIDSNLGTFSQGGSADSAIMYYLDNGTNVLADGFDIYLDESLGGGYEICVNPPYAPYTGNASNYCRSSPFTGDTWLHWDFPEVITTNRLALKMGWIKVLEFKYTGISTEPPVADFNATPLNGTAPLYVAFQDTSEGSPTSHTWAITPANGLIGNTSTSAYPTVVFTLPGNYTVNHCVTNAYGSDCEEKTDYIHVYSVTSDYATTTFWAVDPLGHRVWDSAISLQDVGNSSWTNTSSPSGGVATITSLIGHTINGYATAAGYNDGETLGIIADGVSGGIILMTPTNITNVSAGYVTLYVYVKESAGNTPISGAYVNIAYAEGGSTRNDGGTTSTEGLASFVVPNDTLIYVYGEKVGYDRVSTTKDSGSASGGSASVSVILYMGSQTVTPTVTATTGPGGTVPVTVDPRTPQEKESDIALILIDYGDMLVMFFIALTVIGGVKMIMK